MTQRIDFVKAARAEVGVIEGPKDNETKYGKFAKANFLPWCGSFVMWCAAQADLKIPNVVGTAAGAAAFKKKKQWQDAAEATPEVGDIVFFDFPNDGVDRISHVGIVIKNNEDGTVTTIEGNTAPDKKGDQRNGGQVCKKVRAYQVKNRTKLKRSLPVHVVGFGKPIFKD
jgi:surface antigen